jgi:colanic acid biosynthesis glycosyl transferase WcaI
MKILAIEEGFPPELMSSHFALEFAQELTHRGYSLSVVTLFPRKHLLQKPVHLPKNRLFYWDQNYDRVCVLRVFPQFQGASEWQRAVEYFVSSVSLLIGGLFIGKKDLIHVGTPPLFVAFAACLIAKIRSVPLVLRIWDIHPDALEKIGVIKNRFLLGAMRIIEHFVYRHADAITVISKSYKNYLLKGGIPESKTTVIPLWTKLQDISNAASDFDFRRTYRLEGKFVVTYAGSLSWINDLDTIIAAANLLREHKDIVFVFCGDGIKKDSALRVCKKLKLNNTLFVPPQPMNKYQQIIAQSDVCVISLTKDFTSPALPARLPSMLAYAKTVIAVVPFESDTRRLINEAKFGIWIAPEDAESLSLALLKLNGDPNLNSEFSVNSRKCAEEYFSIEACMNQYDKILQSTMLVKQEKSATK